ncbi:helix-turn-helix domain-containing protein [Bacillus timonensis]|nr:helix-turn-helix domain-containing protein [Bacillus timonensis]
MSNKFYSSEFKYAIIMSYKNEDYTITEICSKYNISTRTLYDWIEKHEKYGLSGLNDLRTWQPYPKELKEEAVRDFLSGKYSQLELIRKYETSSRSVLQRWVKQYNSHRDLKDTSKERTSSMTKGRKTTWEERIQIVLDCLGKGKDYQEAANTYNVSYQQVYQWVKKYEDGGDEALKDKRGYKKEEAKLTQEKINLQMKRLERENERLRAENLFLKKLEEIERRRK